MLFSKAYLLLFLLVLVFSQCTKPTVHYLRPIPMVTFDSRELFGCRINGEPYSPQAADSASLGSCSYYPTYEGDQGFRFQINGDRHEASCRFFSLGIILDSIELRAGASYVLGSPGVRKNYGKYLLVTECSQPAVELLTSDDVPGIVTITSYDRTKKIIRGVFDFKVKDPDGNLYRISDGVFDRHYTN